MASQGRVGSLVLICVCQVLAMMLSVKMLRVIMLISMLRVLSVEGQVLQYDILRDSSRRGYGARPLILWVSNLA